VPGGEKGMANLTILLRMHGEMKSVRGHMKAIIKEHADAGTLCILQGVPPEEVRRWRIAMEKRFLSPSSHAGVNTQALAWRFLFNGDGRLIDRVEHYCSGCCSSAADTLAKMLNVGVAWLFPRPCNWSRKSWLGHAAAVADVALPECVHKLFSRAMGRHRFPEEGGRAPRDGVAGEVDKVRLSAKAFVTSGRLMEDLTELSDCIRCIDRLKDAIAGLAGQKRKRAKLLLDARMTSDAPPCPDQLPRGPPSRYLVTEKAAPDNPISRFLAGVCDELVTGGGDLVEAFGEAATDEEWAITRFKVLSRVGVVTHALVAEPATFYPERFFQHLTDASKWASVQADWAEVPCLFDDVSAALVQDALPGADARAALDVAEAAHALASILQKDSCRVGATMRPRAGERGGRK